MSLLLCDPLKTKEWTWNNKGLTMSKQFKLSFSVETSDVNDGLILLSILEVCNVSLFVSSSLAIN